MAKLRVCLDCHELTAGTRCETHQQATQERVREHRRYDMDPRDGRQAWRRYSERYRAEHPYCAIKAEGCTLLTDLVDHIQPVRSHPHLFDDPSNHRPACQSCNQWAAQHVSTT